MGTWGELWLDGEKVAEAIEDDAVRVDIARGEDENSRVIHIEGVAL